MSKKKIRRFAPIEIYISDNDSACAFFAQLRKKFEQTGASERLCRATCAIARFAPACATCAGAWLHLLRQLVPACVRTILQIILINYA